MEILMLSLIFIIILIIAVLFGHYVDCWMREKRLPNEYQVLFAKVLGGTMLLGVSLGMTLIRMCDAIRSFQ